MIAIQFGAFFLKGAKPPSRTAGDLRRFMASFEIIFF
jgi:hypothetical protein